MTKTLKKRSKRLPKQSGKQTHPSPSLIETIELLVAAMLCGYGILLLLILFLLDYPSPSTPILGNTEKAIVLILALAVFLAHIVIIGGVNGWKGSLLGRYWEWCTPSVAYIFDLCISFTVVILLLSFFLPPFNQIPSIKGVGIEDVGVNEFRNFITDFYVTGVSCALFGLVALLIFFILFEAFVKLIDLVDSILAFFGIRSKTLGITVLSICIILGSYILILFFGDSLHGDTITPYGFENITDIGNIFASFFFLVLRLVSNTVGAYILPQIVNFIFNDSFFYLLVGGGSILIGLKYLFWKT
ncbi:MAG: hypothetical protein MSIBF_06675 [Candidatus Altiarchaeales archaeon IMC4]|nr:MAG: hypothetical protein MSIBF_06675 [Candidatus Altiarchaeales archaeon IMC4]